MVAPAAITSVLFPLIYAKTSTITIVKTVFNICSIDWELAVTVIFSLPLKYPLKTAEIDTKNTDGDSAISVSFASGICRYSVAITPAPRNSALLPINPIIPNKANAILNTLYAPLLSPSG